MHLSFVEEYRGVFRPARGDESPATARWTLSTVDVGVGGIRFDLAGAWDVAGLGIHAHPLRGTARFGRQGCAYALRSEPPPLLLEGEKRGFGLAFVAAISTLALRVRDADGVLVGWALLRWDPRGGLGRLRARLAW